MPDYTAKHVWKGSNGGKPLRPPLLKHTLNNEFVERRGGISKGMQHAMGLRAMYKDLGLGLKRRAHSKAKAAIGIARRRGLGKLRSLECESLIMLNDVEQIQM